jgi:hypothetical protein
VHVALLEAQHAGRVEASVHARQHGGLACRRHRQIALGELRGIGLVGLEELIGDADRIPFVDSLNL